MYHPDSQRSGNHNGDVKQPLREKEEDLKKMHCMNGLKINSIVFNHFLLIL